MNGTYCLGVFNKGEAYALRKLCKTNKQCTVNLMFRGRGSRKEYGNKQDLPVKYAKNVAIYVKPKTKYRY